jgi:ribonuclease HII
MTKFPNLKEERKLWRKGFKRVVGLDEAGRGALCGPVVAAAVSIIANCRLQIANFKNLRDSKR